MENNENKLTPSGPMTTKTKTGATAGPWKFGGMASWEVFAVEDGEAICTVKAAEEWQDGLLDVKHERAIAEANARLIAAAPDLLEALKKVSAFLNDLSTSNPGYLRNLVLQDYAQFNEAMIAMPKAIARATEGQ